MGYLEFCSNCGKKNHYGYMDGNTRRHCTKCDTIHYENPKPTATLICPRKEEILLVKRAQEPGKGLWGLPGGFIEREETPEIAAARELKEETNLKGKAVALLGTCSHFNTMYGDILLIGIEMEINDWSKLQPGDDADAADFINLKKISTLAFPCYDKIVDMYRKKQ